MRHIKNITESCNLQSKSQIFEPIKTFDAKSKNSTVCYYLTLLKFLNYEEADYHEEPNYFLQYVKIHSKQEQQQKYKTSLSCDIIVMDTLILILILTITSLE